VSIMLAVIMRGLDNTIANVALPHMQGSLSASHEEIGWVLTSYIVSVAITMPLSGWLAGRLGIKYVYLYSIIGFTIASALCGAATNLPELVIFRALQGIGGAALVPLAQATLLSINPPERHGQAMAVFGSGTILGPIAGPALGGWLTDTFGWRSIFYVNVPIGIIALVLGSRVQVAIRTGERRDRFDLAGAVVYVLGLILLLLGLNQGHVWGWTSGTVLGCLLAGLALLGAWVAIELRVPSPMLDLRLFAKRTFSAPVVSALLNYGASITTSFLLPFALIQGRDLSPAQAGLILTCQPIVMAATASMSGSLSDKIGSRAPATIGMGVLAVGLFLLSQVTLDTPIALIVGMLLLTGLGIGLFTSPNNSAVLGAVPAQQRGVANGILGTARTLGMLLGIALAGAVYATTLGLLGDESQAGILQAADTGFMVAIIIAAIGVITSATRPAVATRGAPAH